MTREEMTESPLWLRVAADFTREEHIILLDIMTSQYGIKEELMNANVLQIIAARHENPNEEAMESIYGMIDNGKKIEAIKEYRRCFGVELKEAKKAVDKLVLDRNPEF